MRGGTVSITIAGMFFDAHLRTSSVPPLVPPELFGAILFGGDVDESLPAGRWLRVEIRAQLAGVVAPPVASTPAAVIDFQMTGAELLERLKRPKPEWFPLIEPVRQQRQFLHFNLPPGISTVIGVKKLAEHFPKARFFVDPFQHGPEPGWQAQVRLAETENIWLTTLGLAPGAACRWARAEDLAEAIYFTMGEVGASKLLYASGMKWDAPEFSSNTPRKWLAEIQSLDEDQRALIVELNARELFG